MESEKKLVIELFSDVVCPWCYIGETRLWQAAETLKKENPEFPEIKLIWRPFQLQPDMPEEGLPWKTFLIEKFGGEARAKSMFQHVANQGLQDGILFNFEGIPKVINTAKLHQLILKAEDFEKQNDLAEACMRAYFCETKDLSNTEIVKGIVSSVGLPESFYEEAIQDAHLKKEVEDSQSFAASADIRGVPFFIVGDKFALHGAQPYDIFRNALIKAIA